MSHFSLNSSVHSSSFPPGNLPTFLYLCVSFLPCLQWRNAWAPCKWGPRWWSSAEAPKDWCGSSIWMNTSPASAGGLHARMKRPRVSFLFITAQRQNCALPLECMQVQYSYFKYMWSHWCHLFFLGGGQERVHWMFLGTAAYLYSKFPYVSLLE